MNQNLILILTKHEHQFNSYLLNVAVLQLLQIRFQNLQEIHFLPSQNSVSSRVPNIKYDDLKVITNYFAPVTIQTYNH